MGEDGENRGNSELTFSPTDADSCDRVTTITAVLASSEAGPWEVVHPESQSLKSGLVIAQYELIRRLGTGGMSTVFVARDIRLGRRVAIKLMAKKNDCEARRFQAEARATARCKHENIVDIYDVGEAYDHSYMVLEYLEGITLGQWLKQHRTTPTTADKNQLPTKPSVMSPPVSPSGPWSSWCQSCGLLPMLTNRVWYIEISSPKTSCWRTTGPSKSLTSVSPRLWARKPSSRRALPTSWNHGSRVALRHAQARL